MHGVGGLVNREPRGHVCAVSVRPQLGALAAAWDRLAAMSPLPSPFLRSWWLAAMASRRTRFVLVLDGDELIGGLAVDQGRRAGVATLTALGDGPLAPDHLDLVALPDREVDVVAALRRWLRRPGSRLVDYAGAVPAARLSAVLGERVCVTVIEEAPWVSLPPNFAAYVTQLPPIMRNSIRRSGNRLARQGLQFRVVGPGEVDRCLSQLHRLHLRQFGPDSGLVREFDAFSTAAHAGVRCGELLLFELAAGSVVAAVDVAFHVAGRLSYYQGGRDTDERFSGAGTVLMARGFEWACAAGCTEVDFLRGTERYKEQWAGERRPVLRLRAGVGPVGRGALALVRLRHAESTRRLARTLRPIAGLRRPVDHVKPR